MAAPAILISGHTSTGVVRIERPLADVARSVQLMRESGMRVTARVAPSTTALTETSWFELFAAERVLRDLGISEFATYNE